MERVHRGFEHHEEIEQVEGVRVVIVLIEIENGVGNEFVDERLSLARHGTMAIAEVIKIREGTAIIVKAALNVSVRNLRKTALVVLFKHPDDGKSRKGGWKRRLLW